MRHFGEKLGRLLVGGEVLELSGDVGAGKTVLTKGLAEGMGVEETVQSPTFTISRVYSARDELELRHYDFYRLSDPGIMSDELAESASSDKTVVVVEWAGLVEGVLPEDRLKIEFQSTSEHERILEIEATGQKSQKLLEQVS